MKPTVRRARTDTGHLAPGWILTRVVQHLGMGVTTVTRHPTWQAAHDAIPRRHHRRHA